jgi:hypothetical protein
MVVILLLMIKQGEVAAGQGAQVLTQRQTLAALAALVLHLALLARLLPTQAVAAVENVTREPLALGAQVAAVRVDLQAPVRLAQPTWAAAAAGPPKLAQAAQAAQASLSSAS